MWKKRIIKYFISRFADSFYLTQDPEQLYNDFASHFEKNTQIAYSELVKKNIVKEYTINGTQTYGLNMHEKNVEIDKILFNESDEELDALIRPPNEKTIGLNFRFNRMGSRHHPVKSSYYFYTASSDQSYWIVFIKSKPQSDLSKLILGSVKDKNSKIMKIWSVVEAVSRQNHLNEFMRKNVEDEDQRVCGNNRVRTKAAFIIFEHLKWLKRTKEKGNVVHYKVTKK